jgi:hypothetical protein
VRPDLLFFERLGLATERRNAITVICGLQAEDIYVVAETCQTRVIRKLTLNSFYVEFMAGRQKISRSSSSCQAYTLFKCENAALYLLNPP